MKLILFSALALAMGSSASHADDLAASPQAKGARFAAMSLTKDQGLRAIISNVLAPANGTVLASCQVQVSFFDADGSAVGDATTVQLKAGESTFRAGITSIETRASDREHRRRCRSCQSVRAEDER